MNKTKKAIFDSAIKIFSINGFYGATMDDIAQNAGVAKGTLYYHFKSKEEIFTFIIKEGLQTIKEQTFMQIENEEDDIKKLKVFFRTQLNLVNEYKDFLKVVISQLWGENSRHLELRNEIYDYAKGLEKYVKQAVNSKLIKDEDVFLLSCSILGAVCSLAIHDLIKNDAMINREDSINQTQNPQNNVVDNDYYTSKLIEYLFDGIGMKVNK